MEVFCHDCTFTKEYGEAPSANKCPQCGSEDLRFEKDDDWHNMCRFIWAAGSRFFKARSSLPRWIFRKNRLRKWEEFKSGLSHPEVVGPPPCKPNETDKAVEFWVRATGVYQTLNGIVDPCLSFGIMIDQLR